ncbi:MULTISPECIES: hypothetical protein [Streptomyces]|uniref:Uncharacterized protein n=1 Tax=Streptomyces melanosporofaciens TaxID=67327 RepID=A0A1H5B5T9_STRMJ|nr:hypothetical protein [Streptomyces melanosporofaciens]SED49454.1 hypothetical protein SAMN04490356_8694 [Streptomyces melanosporofaciens]
MHPTPPPLSSYVASWAPGPVAAEDALPVGPVVALSAVLDLPEAVAKDGEPLPPLWHWLYFLHWPAQRELGADGHPRNGHFLPPIPHRQPYAQGEEGYPGAVVHGPLLALLMLELVRRHAPARRVASLSYRLRRPLFAGERLVTSGTPSGGGADLRIATHREARHATAEVTFA